MDQTRLVLNSPAYGERMCHLVGLSVNQQVALVQLDGPKTRYPEPYDDGIVPALPEWLSEAPQEKPATQQQKQLPKPKSARKRAAPKTTEPQEEKE